METWVLSGASNFSDTPLHSGNTPKPQHWKSDESTETSAEEDRDWNDDSDADWTIDSEDHSSLFRGSACALVASDEQASLRCNISEIDLLVSEEESESNIRVLEGGLGWHCWPVRSSCGRTASGQRV